MINDPSEAKYSQAERQMRVMDLEGSLGRLEEAVKMLTCEEDVCNNHTQECIESAKVNIEMAITEYNEEIRRLSR